MDAFSVVEAVSQFWDDGVASRLPTSRSTFLQPCQRTFSVIITQSLLSGHG